MVDVNTQVKLISWPSPQDYNEAIQDLRANTQDSQLQNGQVQLTRLGLPRPLTGAFASVYHVECADTAVAVRCFLRDIRDQETRYQLISDFVQNDSLPYTVTFDFLRSGIRVGPNWFPALKMDWVTGPNLDQYVQENLDAQEKLKHLANAFQQMCAELHRDGIAHGDLQHGNIIVCGDELRLVDYDGMYVPAMRGMQSNELGHRNYQHPSRGAQHFNAELDNFSSWIIYASLHSLAIDPTLWDKLAAGDDCLLFRRDDYVSPEYSYAFSILESHESEDVRTLARTVRWLSHQPIENIPPLTSRPAIDESSLPQLQPPSRVPRRIEEALVLANEHPSDGVARYHKHHAMQTDVEAELDQPLPRWVAKKFEGHGSAADEELLTLGEATKVLSLHSKEIPTVGEEPAHFYLKYSFIADGKLYRKEQEVSYDMVWTVKNTSELTPPTVIYWPTFPEKCSLYPLMSYRAVKIDVPANIEPELCKRRRVTEKRTDNGGAIGMNVVIAALLIFAFLTLLFQAAIHVPLVVKLIPISMMFGGCVIYASEMSKQFRLVSYGIPAHAEVVTSSLTEGSAPFIRFTYRYMSPSGPIEKTITSAHPSLTSAHVGDKLTVLYNLDKPEEHVLYATAAYKAQGGNV